MPQAKLLRSILTTILSLLAVLPAMAQQDLTPPTILSVSLSTSTINTGESNQIVSAFVGFTDDLAGLTGGAFGFCAERPTGGFIECCQPGNIVSGGALAGVLGCDFDFDRFREFGIYPLDLVVCDAVGNCTHLRSEDLAANGFPAAIINQDGSGTEDQDLDGVPDASDNCPTAPNADQADIDFDLLGDLCDPFPSDPCNYIGSRPRSTALLGAFQDNSCENWSGTSQPGSNLQSAFLPRADLRLANLNGVLLLNANLSGASLADATLVSSQLRFANLSSAIVTNADLRFSNLLGANLVGADLTSADLSFAVVTGAMYNESTIFPSGDTYSTSPWGLDGGITPWNAGMIPTPEPSMGLLVSIGALGIGGLAVIRGRGRLRDEHLRR